MTLALIALSVAMDCTAVSASYALKKISGSDLVKLAITFGSFQAATALIGALGGKTITSYLGAWDAWIAFILLLAVGTHMIFEALSEDSGDTDHDPHLYLATFLALGIATSIDSLAVGVTLPALGLPITLSVFVIGVVSFGMSFVGAWAGRSAGKRFGPSVEIAGGLVLIGIGARALILEYS